LLKQLAQHASTAVVICAGGSQRELIERGVREHRYRPAGLLGSAPEALAAAMRALIALETNGSVKDIALTVLGVPPMQTVIPWQTVTVAGFAATDVLSEPARRRIEARIALLWPPGPYALAAAAVETIASIVTDSRRTLSCFVAGDDDDGRRYRAAALPVRVGPNGVTKMPLPELDPRARVALDTAIRL
jgi:malate/lactate dehydrogenase